MSRRLLGLCLVAATVCSAGPLQAASPVLSNIRPQGGQRGTEVEVSFNGDRLKDAQEVFYYQPGIETVSLEPNENGKSVKVKLKIAGDAPLGEHALRLRSATGVSEMRSFYVGALPSVEEKEPNNEFAAPQPIDLNATVSGVANSEDVDYYAVKCTKGQRLSVEVEGMRLGNTMFDPYCAILDDKRFELAASDDAPLVYQDCVASVVIPEDGTYVVEVRESSYAGNGNCHYRAHIGTFPRPTAVYPAGGKIGENVQATFISGGGQLVQSLTLPPVVLPEYTVFAQDGGGVAPSGNVFRISTSGNTLEVEPNNDAATATVGQLPTTFNGIVQQPGDVDFFKFTATKGQVFEVECYARRLRTGLDS
ncbi:MAG TPA: PPC domain-containing protein, partial [Pirellulales bacterium]